MMNVNDLPEDMKVAVFLCGAMRRLYEMGYVTGVMDNLTPFGLSQFDQLEASGYRPSRSQLAEYITTYADYPRGDLDGLLSLLEHWDELKDYPVTLQDPPGSQRVAWTEVLWLIYFAASNMLLLWVVWRHWFR